MHRTLRRALPLLLPLWLGCSVDASGLATAADLDGGFDDSVDDATSGDAPADVAIADDSAAGDTSVAEASDGSLFEVGAPCVDPASDCPKPAICTAAACTGGLCATSLQAPRTPCVGPGGATLCDGAGACVSCILASDCAGPAGTTCAAGTCVAPSCTNGKKDGMETDIDCGGPCGKCSLGKNCGAANDCSSGACTGGKCVCTTDAQCGGGKFCDAAGSCKNKVAQAKPCTRAGECTTSFCVDGVCCDGVCNGTCRACTGALKASGPDGTCGPAKDNLDPHLTCTASASAPCGNVGVCAAGACKQVASGTVCAAATCSGASAVAARTCDGAGTCNAASTADCAPYACDASAKCKTSCLLPSDCATGYYCNVTTCAPKKTKGAGCVLGTECGTGNCVDSVCCDTACNGVCQTCGANGSTGAAGTCSDLPLNTDDPALLCTGIVTCNGSGSCGSVSGQPCVLNATCASGTCNLSGGSGSGKCQ